MRRGSLLRARLFVNGVVKGALGYFLAEGERDPLLVHDPHQRLDAQLTYQINAGLSKRRP